jgi:hypothetical protein
LFVKLDPLICHHCGGYEELQDRANVLSCCHVRWARMACFRLQICFPWAAAYSQTTPLGLLERMSSNVMVLYPPSSFPRAACVTPRGLPYPVLRRVSSLSRCRRRCLSPCLRRPDR